SPMTNENQPPRDPNGSDQVPPSTPPRANRLARGRAGRKDKRSRTEPQGDIVVRITPDDIKKLRLVDKFRLLDATQLYKVLGGNGHPRAFSHRLEQLFHSKDGSVLDRPPAQWRGGEPARPYIYAVGPRGRRELDKVDGIERRGRRDFKAENDRLGFTFLDHEI